MDILYICRFYTYTRLYYLIFTVLWAFPYDISYKAEFSNETMSAVKPLEGYSKCYGGCLTLKIMCLNHRRRMRGNRHGLQEGWRVKSWLI